MSFVSQLVATATTQVLCSDFDFGVSFYLPVHRERGKIEGFSCVGGTCSSMRALNSNLMCSFVSLLLPLEFVSHFRL